MKKPEDATRDRDRTQTFTLLLICFIVSLLFPTPPAVAMPSQYDVFKSIHDSVDERTSFDSRPVFLLARGGGATVLLLVLMNRREKRGVKPKTFNHQGKLVKEIMRQVPLKNEELRQLKILAESARHTELGEVNNPLALLLCPSALAKTLQARQGKVDRQAVAQVVRKLNLRSSRAGDGEASS